jgi:hypothetical protein
MSNMHPALLASLAIAQRAGFADMRKRSGNDLEFAKAALTRVAAAYRQGSDSRSTESAPAARVYAMCAVDLQALADELAADREPSAEPPAETPRYIESEEYRASRADVDSVLRTARRVTSTDHAFFVAALTGWRSALIELAAAPAGSCKAATVNEAVQMVIDDIASILGAAGGPK